MIGKKLFSAAIAAAFTSCLFVGLVNSDAATVTVSSQNRFDKASFDATTNPPAITHDASGNSAFSDTINTKYSETVTHTGTITTAQKSSYDVSGSDFDITATGQAELDANTLDSKVTLNSNSQFELIFKVTQISAYNFLGSVNPAQPSNGQNATISLVLGSSTNILNLSTGGGTKQVSMSKSGMLAVGTYTLTATAVAAGPDINANYEYSILMAIAPQGPIPSLPSIGPVGAAVPLPSAAWSSLTFLAGLGAIRLISRRFSLSK